MSNVQICFSLGYVKTPSVMLGVCFFAPCYIAFQARPNSVPAENVSAAFFSPKKGVSTFGYSLGTQRVPARLILEQGRQHKQILYATAATPPSFLKYMSYRLYRITRELILFCKPDADGKGFICAMNKTPVKSS